jgi:SAP domain
MSRFVDVSDPSVLDEDDIHYLHQRGRWPLIGDDAREAEEVVEMVVEDEEEYKNMTVAALRERATERGLDSSGPKQDLIDRLVAADIVEE